MKMFIVVALLAMLAAPALAQRCGVLCDGRDGAPNPPRPGCPLLNPNC